MGRGRQTPDETIERIKATYAMNGNARETSRVLSVPLATVLKYVDPETKGEFDQVRSEKLSIAIPDIVERCKQVQIVLLDALMDKVKIKEADYRDIGVTFGIVTDKLQLITGEATERHEHRNTSEARDLLVSRVDELAARRRARLDSERVVGATGT